MKDFKFLNVSLGSYFYHYLRKPDLYPCGSNKQYAIQALRKLPKSGGAKPKILKSGGAKTDFFIV